MAAKDIEAGRAHVLLRIRDQLTQGLKTAERKMQQFGQYVSLSAGVVTGGLAGALGWPLKLAADMEQATVSFEVFTGSATVAKQLLTDIEAMAAKTPFQFPELRDSAQLLMGFGATASQVLPMLQMLGDVSGGNSERFQRLALAFGQVMAKGRLMGQEVMQMTEQGFNPLSELSKLTGKSMATLMKEMEDGAISFPMLVKAFQSATGPGGRFNGMMEKQSQTLAGLFSSLIDYSKMAAVAFGNTLLPIFKRIVTIGIGVAQSFTAIVKANSGLVAGIAKTLLIIGTIAGVFAGIGIAALAASFVVGLIASGFAAIGTVLATIFSPIGLLIGFLVALGVNAYYFRGAIFEAFQGLMVWLSPVTAFFGRILEAGSGAVQGIVAALSSGNIQLAGTIAVQSLRAMFIRVASEIPRMIEVAMLRVRVAMAERSEGAALAWAKFIYRMRTGWQVASAGIASAFVWVIGSLQTGITTIINAFDWLITKARIAAVSIQGYFAGTMDKANTESAKLQADYEKRVKERSAANAAGYKVMTQSLADSDKAAQDKINKDYQAAVKSRLGSTEALRNQLAQATSPMANDAAANAADNAVAAARAELEASIAAANSKKPGAGGPGDLLRNFVPGLAGGGSALPKVSSQGTFSAAAAAAFGSRGNAQEQTAANTLAAKRYLKEIKDKQGGMAFI